MFVSFTTRNSETSSQSEPDARITKPQLIKQYNNDMAEVDVIDRLLGF